MTDKADKIATEGLEDINIFSLSPLLTPADIHSELPVSQKARETVIQGRETVRDIIARNDPRLLVVVGPCSIHDTEAAMDYARRLKKLANEVSDTLYIVMRVYFEKPRTTTGWKGLINDPDMDDSFHIEKGIRTARKLLLDILELGLPTSTEALDPITPQYLQDLIVWSAIGARTTESQTHRELASGLSSAVGFKNGTDGSLGVAINALQSVASPHRFLGINKEGKVSVVHSKGNPQAHIVLRGGNGKPNYDYVSVRQAEEQLAKAGLRSSIMIDCSHANSNKNHELQALVLDNITHQIMDGNRSIMGLMIESNLHAGNQKIPEDRSQLKYGVSITDACIDWPTTQECLHKMQNSLRDILSGRID